MLSRLVALACLLTVTGCFFRPEVRRVNPDYRSEEAFGNAHWGMTEEELQQVAPGLAPCGTDWLCRDETLKDRPARVTYELARGQLVRVRVRVETNDPRADYDRFKEELTEAYGPRAQISSARVRVGPYAVVALMDAVGSTYKPILGPLVKTDEGWTTNETEMRLQTGQTPNGWLELTLTSRLLARTALTLEGP